ncbi:MAG: hypothetical protein ACOY0T_11815 [Myxococcota bacterium]
MSLKRLSATSLLIGLCAFTPACAALFGSGPTEVAQGRYYSVGNAEFDAFFVSVYRQQLAMARAPEELRSARHELTEALVLGESAQNAEIAEKLRLALNALSQRGARVHFEVRLPTPPDPEHSMALITATPNPEGKERNLLSTVEASLTRLLRLAAGMHQSSTELATLRAEVPQLQAKVDRALFEQGPRKRERTLRNLEDAERVMVLMQARAEETAAPIDGLYKELSRVFSKPDPAPVEAPPAPKPEDKPKPRPVARPRADPASVATSPAATPKPAPATKSADFEP